MRYLAERELRKDNSNENPNNDRKDIEECIENAKVKEEIERSFEEDFNPAILGYNDILFTFLLFILLNCQLNMDF